MSAEWWRFSFHFRGELDRAKIRDFPIGLPDFVRTLVVDGSTVDVDQPILVPARQSNVAPLPELTYEELGVLLSSLYKMKTRRGSSRRDRVLVNSLFTAVSEAQASIPVEFR